MRYIIKKCFGSWEKYTDIKNSRYLHRYYCFLFTIIELEQLAIHTAIESRQNVVLFNR